VVTVTGCSPNAHDLALFVYTSSRDRTLLLLFVDDMIIIGDDFWVHCFCWWPSLWAVFLWLIMVLFATLLGLRFTLPLMDSIDLRRSISIHDLLAHAALGDECTIETPMGSMFTFVPLTVIPYMIDALSSPIWEPCLHGCHSLGYFLSCPYSNTVRVCSHLGSLQSPPSCSMISS
jgi:hypothetical protein